MTTFDDSPRATKRRKTDSHSSPNLPLSSRAIRAVKEAVFGKPPLRSSPRSKNGSGSHGHAAPVQFSKQTDYKNLEENVDWDVPDSEDDGPGNFVRPSTQAHASRDNSIVHSNGTTSIPTNRRSGRKEKIHLEKDRDDGSVKEGTKILATPTKKRRSNHRPRSESQDRDELGSETAEGEIRATAKRVRDGANTREEACGRRQRQESGKVADEKSSRISATLHQPEIRDGSPISKPDTSSQVIDSSGDLNLTKPIRSRSKLRHESDAQAVEEDEIVKIARTPPTTRSSRKRGLEEFSRIDDATADILTTTPSNRKRGRPRKQTPTATIAHNVQDDDLGSKSISSRHGSIDPLLNQTKRDDNITPNDEISLPATARRTPGKKYRRAAEATPDTSIAAHRALSRDVVGSGLEINIEDSIKDHIKEFRNVLENHPIGLLTALKSLVMDGLTGKRRIPLVNLEEEYQKVRQLLEQTLLAGEGNSMLVVGSRGTAKTVLVETVIEELAIDHREDFHVVRLNGFIHTDDKFALREIWRQLGREMEIEDDAVGTRSNYADTLTSLLALLSHSPETSETEQSHIAKSVIFVIDEFDLFASHPRQTLLYNLFDVAQSRNAPIAVLGLTTKVDVVDSLEKRVKSRFSQRYVHLSLPKSYAAFQGICKSALASQNATMAARLKHDNANLQKLYIAWTNYVDALFTEDSAFDTFLLKIYTRSKSVPSFLTACLLPISLLSTSHIPTGLDFAAKTLLPPDSKLHLLPGLSSLELSLLIAAARLDIILDTDMCNFNMACGGGGGARWPFWPKIVPDRGKCQPGHVGRADGRMWRVDVGLEEIGPSASGMSEVMAKWCREI